MQSSSTKYWIGPYGVLVPDSINLVVSEDGYNLMFQDGDITERGCCNPDPMNATIYKTNYAIYNEANGLWYYKEPKENDENDENEEHQ
ncbi:hypothetical protein CE11_00051 [Megavirus courdo11]|uniref:Uncharacterized protein n=1 Tax=Megavirus courdo11 TaxID=1128140 RepID=K7YFZ4_9VIRU|nr:hypothetical protein CE11_00051 [Megavirus courdo11]